MVGTSNHRSPAGAGARGAVPAGESLAGIPWKLNIPFFSGGSVRFRSFEKEAIIFAEYVGFGHVLKDTREIPVADPFISYAKLKSLGFTDDEIDTHRRAYQFLPSAITSEVARGILHRAHSPTEAWRNFKKVAQPRYRICHTNSPPTLSLLHHESKPKSSGYPNSPWRDGCPAFSAEFSNAPLDQAVLQFMSILPDSEYEVEKRTCSTGQRLDRDQVLLMIRTRYDNLQRQRNKGGGRMMLVTLFLLMLEVPGRPGAVVPREALKIVGVGAEVAVGAEVGTEEKRVAKKRMVKQPTAMLATETPTAVKETTQGATVVARSATKRCDAPDRCVAFAAERAIWQKYALTSSPSLPAKLTRVAATVKRFSAEKSRTSSSAMH